MKINIKKGINSSALAWAIRQNVGINLGGYNETKGIQQTGSIQWSDMVGLELELSDDLPESVVWEIREIVEAHEASAAVAGDFPKEVGRAKEDSAKEAYEKAGDKMAFIAKHLGLT